MGRVRGQGGVLRIGVDKQHADAAVAPDYTIAAAIGDGPSNVYSADNRYWSSSFGARMHSNARQHMAKGTFAQGGGPLFMHTTRLTRRTANQRDARIQRSSAGGARPMGPVERACIKMSAARFAAEEMAAKALMRGSDRPVEQCAGSS